MALVGYTADLQELIFNGSPMLPESDSYTVHYPDSVESIPHLGGLSTGRLKYHNEPYVIQATYHLGTKPEVDVFEVFIIENIGEKCITHHQIDGDVEPFVTQFLGVVSMDKTGLGARVTLNFEVQHGS